MEIIDWLSENYKWMFSGIGVVIGIPLVTYIYNKIKSNHINVQNSISPTFVEETGSKQKENIIENNNTLNISAKEIESKRKHLSELEFEDYFTSLNGHTIAWNGKIATVSAKNKGKKVVRIQMTFESHLRTFFDINISEFPNVKLFKSGDTATINGKVYSADWPTFDLLNAKFLDWSKK